jgi:hypothetical protein
VKVNYKELSKLAYERSITLDLVPRSVINNPITGALIKELNQFCDSQVLPFLLQRFGTDYWGNSCLNLAAQTFYMLQHIGINCELVYGEVNINGVKEFDTTIAGLVDELKEPREGGLAIHVWVQVGKDFIIDPTISARINKYYNPDYPPHLIVNGLSKKLFKENRLDYEPMLMGAKYLTTTCGIPLEYIVVD